jgi:hypothetical protein
MDASWIFNALMHVTEPTTAYQKEMGRAAKNFEI